MLRALLSSHVAWLSTPHRNWRDAETLVVPWAVQFVCSWAAFLLYMRLDYEHYMRGSLYGPSAKLPSRHPLRPFWAVQLRMVPLVLFNQCVVWPLVSLAVVWPLWARTNTSALGDVLGGWRAGALLPAFLACMAASDQLWYWCHRLLHVRLLCGVRIWDRCHREHHCAEQCALSATFVHPLEYALFTFSMQIFFAAAGFPMYLHALPLGWGMFTGSGAHSGYRCVGRNGRPRNGRAAEAVGRGRSRRDASGWGAVGSSQPTAGEGESLRLVEKAAELNHTLPSPSLPPAAPSPMATSTMRTTSSTAATLAC